MIGPAQRFAGKDERFIRARERNISGHSPSFVEQGPCAPHRQSLASELGPRESFLLEETLARKYPPSVDASSGFTRYVRHSVLYANAADFAGFDRAGAQIKRRLCYSSQLRAERRQRIFQEKLFSGKNLWWNSLAEYRAGAPAVPQSLSTGMLPVRS